MLTVHGEASRIRRLVGRGREAVRRLTALTACRERGKPPSRAADRTVQVAHLGQNLTGFLQVARYNQCAELPILSSPLSVFTHRRHIWLRYAQVILDVGVL